MADRKICEEIEIAIYSDAVLTKEQENHIQNCESCRALLSQIKCIKEDLSSTDLLGLEQGKITLAVMDSIKKQKTSLSFPKFRITHHLGTVAAVIIILVAALMIKNPADDKTLSPETATDDKAVVFDSGNDHVLNGIAGGGGASSYDGSDNVNGALADSNAEAENGVIKYTLFAADNVSEDYADEEAVSNEAITEEFTEEATDEAPVLMLRKASKGALQQEEMPEEEFMDTLGEEPTQDMAKELETSKSAALAQEDKYLFSGIQFKKGEENFAFNVSLANKRLSELYGDKYVISKEKLEKMGVTNAKLLKIAPTVTFEQFDFYKNILDVFE